MNTETLTNPPISSKTVLVCGSLHLDVVVDAPQLPRKDETVVGSSVNYICGGKGGNQAVAAALNGASTSFIGATGSDDFGEKLTANLQRNNIDCSGLQTISGASGMSVAIVDDHGDYGAVIVSASNLHIDSNAIEIPESAGILLLQNEITEDANQRLALQANALNIPVMLNAAPYRSIATPFEKLIDILVLNRVEAEQFFSTHFSGIDDVVEMLSKTDSSISTIIITLGADGLIYRNSAGQVHVKLAYPVKVISSHGAGDMFCGALASRIISGEVTNDALEYAMAAAAWHVSAGLPERSALNIEAINSLREQHLSS